MTTTTDKPIAALEWCDTMLKQWENIVGEYDKLDAQPNKTLIEKAKLKRAEKDYTRADILASVAFGVQQFMQATPKGVIKIELPEVELAVTLEW